jgi:capsular exopolysaccharide synthesis family protein
MAPPIVTRFRIAFKENWYIFFSVWALITGLAALYPLTQQKPQAATVTYNGLGQLSFSTPPPILTTAGEQVQQQGRQLNPAVLYSSEVRNQIIQRLKKDLQLSDEKIREIILEKDIPKFPEKEEDAAVITLQYKEVKNPQEATDVVKIFMEEMIARSRFLNASQLRTKINSLEDRSKQAKQELGVAEEQFYKFIKTDGSQLLSVQNGSLFNGIASSQQQQRELQLVLDQLDGEINSIVQQLGLKPEEAYASSALSADPILGDLRTQILEVEAQIKLLEKDLRAEHPRLVALRKQLSTTESLYQNRASEVIGGKGIVKPLTQIRQDSSLDPARQELANRLVSLKTQRDGISRQLNSVKNNETKLKLEYEQFPDRQLQQSRLTQELEAKRAFYQQIVLNLVDAKAAEAETVSSLAIALAPSVEEISTTPPPPLSTLLVTLGGSGVGLLLALGTLFLLATLDDRLHTPEELQEALTIREVPILGKLPYVASFDLNGKETSILMDVDSVYLTYYERFRSNLRRLGNEASKVILIASIINDEGKTITAYNLAIASAQAGKRTLLIEADLRSPTLASSLKIDPDPDATIQPLHYYAARGDAIRLVPTIENLYILPSPGPLRQVAAILESSELRRLLEDARGRFDLVVIDSPSLSKCNDALLLQSLTDGMVLVTRPGLTKNSMLTESIDKFSEEELPLLGVVINAVDRLVPTTDLVPDKLSSQLKKNEDLAESVFGSGS